MLIKFTARQQFDAKHHLQIAAERAVAAYWDRTYCEEHDYAMLKSLSSACQALGITIDASGKVENIQELTICEMAATIKGMTDPLVMRAKLLEQYTFKKAAGWMGAEAIKYELRRAEQEAGGK